MNSEKLNHLENILQEIESTQRQLFDLNTKLGLLAEEVRKYFDNA